MAGEIMVGGGGDMLRVEVRFKNGRLYDAITEHDLPILPRKSAAGDAAGHRGRVKWFCDFYELQSTSVYDLLNLKQSPFTTNLQLTALPQKLCGLLEKDPEWLFPFKLYEQAWRPLVSYLSEEMVERRNQRFANYQLKQAQRASLPSGDQGPGRAVEQEQLHVSIRDVLQTITPREALVISERFGVAGEPEKSLHEVAARLGVGKERVRQIEAKALRKLRHPSRTRKLCGFLPNPTEQ